MLWTIKRYKELQAKQAPNVETAESSGAAASSSSSSRASCSSSSDAQQLSQDGDDLPLSSEQQARLEKEARSRLAAERRAKILAQMRNAQKSFMKSNAAMFASSNEESASTASSTTTLSSSSNAQGQSKSKKGDKDWVMEWEDIPEPLAEQGAAALMADPLAEQGAAASMPEEKKSIACLGPQSTQSEPEETSYKCILCFADCNTNSSGPPLVSSAFLQTSRVIYTTPNRDTLKSLHASCCGHVMHYSCWKEYYSSEETKEVRRPQRNRGSLNHGQNEEFHCPYCRSLSNTVLPVSEPLSKYLPPSATAAAVDDSNILPLDSFVEIMRTLCSELTALHGISSGDKLCQNVHAARMLINPTCKSILRKSNIVMDMAQFERSAHIIDKPQLDNSWTEVMESLHRAMRGQLYGKQNKDLPSTSDTPKQDTMLLWDTCSYTLQALEVYLFVIKKPLKAELPMRHQSCASNLVRTCALYSSILMQTDIEGQSEQAIKLLDTIFNQKGPSILEWDCFRMLVQLNFAVPNLLVAGDGK